MATISVGAFVPVPGQVVYLTGKASPQFRTRPVRLLITAESKPSTVDANQGRTAVGAMWLRLTGVELGPQGQRREQRTDVPVCKDGIIVCGDPGVRRPGAGKTGGTGGR